MAILKKKYPTLNLNNFLTRKKVFEVTVFLFTISLAGFLGNYIAHLATRQITNELTKFIAGILIGLLIGIFVGIFVKHIWEKIQLIFAKWNPNKNII
jgi:FtsH-binding integral membrane protein